MHQTTAQTLRQMEEEIKANNNATWNISHQTGVFLNTLVRATKAKRILEIGTSTGYSGIWLAEALKAVGGELVTIESHDERFATARKNFKQAELSEVVTQVKGHAPEIFPEIEGTFDMMFFDATKNEHVSYFKSCTEKINVNGLIITDNIISHADEMQDYISYVHAQDNFQTSIVNIGTGLLVSLRIK